MIWPARSLFDPHIVQELGEEFLVGQGVAGNVAEDADVAALLGQAAHDLHAAEQQQIVDHAHQARLAGDLHILGRHDDLAVLVAQARQRFVIAQLALRQADDGLQIKIDAIFFQGRADGFQQLALFAQGVEIGRSRPALRLDFRLRPGRGALGNLAGEVAHQGFQNLQLGDDLLFLGLATLFDLAADFAQPGAGVMQRGLEFQMALAQMRQFLCHRMLVAAARETGRHMLHTDKADHTRQDRHRPAGEQRQACAQSGADEKDGEGQQNPGDGGNAVAHGTHHPSDQFPIY